MNLIIYFLHRKQLCMNAKETKEVWSDEEDLFAFNDKSTIYYLTTFLLKLD